MARYDCSPPQQRDSIEATENAGFNTKEQRNLGLDFVIKQHKSLQKLTTSLYLSASDMLINVNLPTFAMVGPRHGGLTWLVTYLKFVNWLL